MAAMYLLAQLEHLCRVGSRYLEADGIVKRQPPPELRRRVFPQGTRSRVTGVDLAFTLLLYRNTTPLGRRLRALECRLHVAERLKAIRNPVMHGELADLAVEGSFLALLVAMFYYS